MNILVKGKNIVAVAEKISYGVYDEPFKKWRLADSEDKLMHYVIDDGFSLVEGATLPADYEEGKYFYENGSFVKNTEYIPYEAPEDRIARLEADNAVLADTVSLLESCILEMSEIVYA